MARLTAPPASGDVLPVLRPRGEDDDNTGNTDYSAKGGHVLALTDSETDNNAKPFNPHTQALSIFSDQDVWYALTDDDTYNVTTSSSDTSEADHFLPASTRIDVSPRYWDASAKTWKVYEYLRVENASGSAALVYISELV